MAEDDQHADVPPRAVLALHVPERLLRDGGIPDQEVLREMDVGVKHREGEKQRGVVLERGVANDVLERPGFLEKQRDDVNRNQRRPDTAGKVVHAKHGGEPLVLETLHPVDGTDGQRDGENKNPDRRQHTAFSGAIRSARLVLLQGIFPKHPGKEPPNGKTKHPAQMPKSGIQIPLFRMPSMVMGLAGFAVLSLRSHPVVKGPLAFIAVCRCFVMIGSVFVIIDGRSLLGCFAGFLRLFLMVKGGVLFHFNKLHARPDGYGDKQHRHQRQQTGQMLRYPPNRDDPVGVKQVMQQHEKKGPQANAQVEHERHQPRMSKVRKICRKTSQHQHRTHCKQDQRNLIRPRWELQFRFCLLGAGFFLCGH